MSQENGRSWRSSIPLILILVLILVTFGLRLIYVTQISLYIDEFTSIWAAKLILQRGLPLTPAGVIYHRGILFSYVEAFSTFLFGFTGEAGRMASVFIAVVTVPCLYLVGRRMYSDRSGLLAATFLALAPQAIIWGGRARMYALLQLLALLAVYFLYAGVVESRRGIYQGLFAICFIGAIFTQEQAVLLYPALLMAVVVLGRWRWFFQRQGILVNVLCCLAILSRYLLDRIGRPTQFDLVQAAGPSLGFVEGFMASLSAYLSFFLHSDQFPLTILCVLGLICAIAVIAIRGKKPGPSEKKWLGSLVFIYVAFAVTVLEMLIAGGERWSDPRYFFMVLPLFILGASISLDQILIFVRERLPSARTALSTEMAVIPSWPVVCSLVVIVVVHLPGVNSVLSQQIEGHDRAMEYVKDHWREGDVILMASPPICAVYLDHCDYYAIQKAYEGYTISKDGKSVDVWTGTPLLNSVDQLEEVLRESDRLWFVVDGWRLATRYEIGFLQTVAEQMDLVEEVQGVKILLSHEYAPLQEPGVHRSLEVNLEDKVALVGYDLDTDFVRPEGKMCLTLYWQALTSLDQEYTVFVHLVSREDALVGQDDAAPVAGLYPTIYWQEDQTIPDRHCLVPRSDLPDDRYLIEVGMYLPQTAQRLEVFDEEGSPVANRIALDYLQISSCRGDVPLPAHTVEANLADQILLLGYDLGHESSASGEAVLTVQPGSVIPLTLHWQALAPMERDFTVFVHLLDQEGRIWGQADGQPDRGFYPTSFWDVGEVVLDQREIPVDALTPEGDYRLVAGVYVLETEERLPVIDDLGRIEDDKVFLGIIEVGRG